MKATEIEVNEIVKKVLVSLKNHKPKMSIEQKEKETLMKFVKMDYKIMKPFTKLLPMRRGKNKGELVEFSGYVLKKDRNLFAKVFTTKERNKLENVWA